MTRRLDDAFTCQFLELGLVEPELSIDLVIVRAQGLAGPADGRGRLAEPRGGRGHANGAELGIGDVHENATRQHVRILADVGDVVDGRAGEIERLPRAYTFHHSSPRSRSQVRSGSPPRGFSTLMTSAPWSARMVARTPPAIRREQSMTRRPASAPLTSVTRS